jgi:hypothetical protein
MMGQWSNGLRSQQEQAEKAKKVDVPEKSSTGSEQSRSDAPAATGAPSDGRADAIEALREVASKTPRRWP